jgi:adenine-specific DNA-methyltransferase
MKLSVTTNISESFSTVFLNQTVEEKEIQKFIEAFNELYEAVNAKESEENQKNIITFFLKKAFYDPNYAVNTKGRIDLAIFTGKSAKENPVGVIFEAKRPKNKSEMITPEKPNVKAFQELLLYYLDETVKGNNLEVKTLIVTNINDWYIIDAREFEKLIPNDLKSTYSKFKDGDLIIENNPKFYNQIAKPFFDNSKDLPCLKISLEDIHNLIEKKDEASLEALTNYYKLLSPQSLLRLKFANDTNKLNTEFYNELLHIIGLEEVTPEGNKRIITRLTEGKRNDGSLLENTINILKNRNKLKNIDNLELFGENEEQQLFSVGLELCITWLNRILFLKLLEGQLIKYNKGSSVNFSFLNFEKIKDFDELDELFFEVLAVKTSERPKEITNKFGNIPYLNSSLFEPTELEQKVLEVNGIKDRHELPLYHHTVLKDGEKRKEGSMLTLQYLFAFLESYDFASDVKKKVQKERKTIINASVLGLIFEKINGYKDGSFFTPGFVTEFMCREVIRKSVIEKFNSKLSLDCKDWKDLQRKIVNVDILKANSVINDVKICDPAVGSGHFLVSALNEMIAIKHDLQILANSEGKPFRGLNIFIENDELIATLDSELFSYNFKDEKSQEIQETLFNEKKNIIENCLYGVDINPKSAMICRLRLWVELLKNAYYIIDKGITKKEQLELQTLPNIDINIKSGNSLVSRFSIDDKNTILNKDRPFVKDLIARYKILVNGYKDATDKKIKEGFRTQINSIKLEFEKFALPNDKEYFELKKKEGELAQITFAFDDSEKEKLDALANETVELRKKYTEKLRTLYGNSLEWRFEFPEVLDEEGDFEGFDVVIGNPPYFSLSKDLRNPYYKNHYTTFNTAGDIYCLFYELGNKLLANGKNLSFITSNKWMRAGYGKNLREYLLQNTDPYFIFDFSWYQVFENASVDTNILSFAKQTWSSNLAGAEAKNNFKLENINEYVKEVTGAVSVNGSDYWNISSSENQLLKHKIESIGTKIEDWDLKVNYGIKSGLNEAFQIDEEIRKELIAKDKKNKEILIPLLRGRDIERFGYNFANLYLINISNGFTTTIKNPEKNIIEEKDGTFSYKPEGVKTWFKAKRIEQGKGSQYRINRVIVEEDYPTVYEYMKQFEVALKKREDQGSHWTNLRNCAYESEFKKEKLVWAETMRIHKTGNRNFPRFGYDDNKTYTDKTVFIGVGSHLKYLLAVLNSDIGRWLIMEYVQKLDTGGYMMQKDYLDKIPIVKPDDEKEEQINIKIDKILALKKVDINNDTSNIETEINKLVYEIFSLQPEEIKLIEETTKK